jgi:plastocyanin
MGIAPSAPVRRARAVRIAVAVATLTLLAACSDGDGEGDDSPTTAVEAPDGTEAGVTVQGFAFDPQALTVAPGTTVRWTNQDGAEHTVVGEGLSGSLVPGGTFEQRFDTLGTFAYACTIHPSMTGTITVS